MHEPLLGLAGAAAIALVVALLARSRGFSIALPVLAAGVAVELVPFGPDAPPDPEIVLVAALAPLVFGEALSASYRELRAVRRPVLLLAIGLVVVTALAVGWAAAQIIPGMTLAAACALGAVLAPTDAVAVAASARRAGLPRRLVAVLEGESLVNDGTGLTVLRVALVAAAVGGVSPAAAAGVFALSVVAGVAVGLACGFALIWVIRSFKDTVAVNSLVIIAPIPVYFIAERLEGSGILAVVTTALLAAAGMHRTLGFRGRLAALEVWRHITFILQAFAFFLLGLEFPRVLRELSGVDLQRLPVAVLVVLAILIGTRLLVVFGMTALLRSLWDSHRWGSALVASWAGARGPVSGLAVFTIPAATAAGEPFPQRDMIVAITFCVIVVTLLLAPTIGPLARTLDVRAADTEDEVRLVRAALARAALERLDDLVLDAEQRGEPLSVGDVHALRLPLEQDVDGAAAPAGGMPANVETGRRIRETLLVAQQEELMRMRDDGDVSDRVARRLQAEIDVAAAALRGGAG